MKVDSKRKGRFLSMNVVFLGPPGAGKGTQSAMVAEYFKMGYIATGNIMRAALKSGSELGGLAKSYIEKGELVPDDLVIRLIEEVLTLNPVENGYVLDGFPRTIAQAEALDNMGMSIDEVVFLDASEDTILTRMSGRRVCESCGKSYHLISKAPKVDGVCDKCGGTLVKRTDDNLETIVERLKEYHKKTEPLRQFYLKKGKLKFINGDGTIEDIQGKVIKAIEEGVKS